MRKFIGSFNVIIGVNVAYALFHGSANIVSGMGTQRDVTPISAGLEESAYEAGRAAFREHYGISPLYDERDGPLDETMIFGKILLQVGPYYYDAEKLRDKLVEKAITKERT